MAKASLSDLPVDIFLLICRYLDATSFVRLISTCKSLQTTFRDEPAIWASLVRETFRVANQPVVEHDGARWRKLFRRLKTETRAYSWGGNDAQCLGQTRRLSARSQPQLHARVPPVSWPEEMDSMTEAGIISEMQCGGWSTSLLSSTGELRIAGMLDGMVFNTLQSESTYTTLFYPPGFTTNHSRYEPSTTIKQYSHGRQHLLALSDSGRIWSWRNASQPAYHVRFLHHETVEGKSKGHGTVRKVVAGWSKSAALVEGSGIVVWEPLQRATIDHGSEDTALVLESATVPKTDAVENQHDAFVIQNFIVLESSIIFITSEARVFVSRIVWDFHNQQMGDPQEIKFTAKGKAIDVQGSFRSFAIFTTCGAVLTSSEERLMQALAIDTQEQWDVTLDRTPALQNNQVIALAFGDYHFHALHAPGHITSYGKEPQSCGAFGLGSNTPEARLRGIRQQGMQGPGFRARADGYLVPHANCQGRRVWFEREKRDWIKFMASGGREPEEAVERIRMALGSAQIEAQGEVSEWIEQEGRDWEDKFDVKQEGDGLPAYFALNVAAAGWHSAALVLVNDRLVDAITRTVEMPAEDTADAARSPQGPAASYGVSSWVTWAVDLGRWFLGLPIQDATYAQPSQTRVDPVLAQAGVDTSRRDPTTYGAAPRAGFRYTWANDHFPRLQLSSGTEMPGTVPFDTWRYGRPDWQMENT